MALVIVIIILGIGIAVVSFFLIRAIAAPKRVETLQNLLKQNKTQAAIKGAKQIIAKDARNADGHYLLGLAYNAEEKRELALMEFKTVSQIGHFGGLVQEVPFRQKIAELYANFNQPDEALKEYLLLIRRDPLNSDTYYRVGNLFELRDRSGKAAGYYKKATEVDPRNAAAHARFGMLLYRAKRSLEAREHLDMATRLDSENYEAWYYIGKILKDAGDCVAALSAFEKANRDPELKVKALIERGGCFIKLDNMERAIAELDRAANLADAESNELLYARYFLAHCYEKTRQIESAVGEWETIHSIKPRFKDVAEKLSKYQGLRADDRIKDFLTVGQEKFVDICKQATESMGLTVRDIQSIEGGCEIIAVEPTSKWRNVRAMPKLIRYFRLADTVGESTVRDAHEEMKKQNITRGLLVTSSSFSRMATEYAQSRPIDLYSRERLQSLLQKVDM